MARFNKLDIPHQWKDEFTKYPHGYSIFEAISKWVDLVNRMITNINAWNEYLGGFTSTFGEVPQQMVELRQEMMVLLDNVNSDLTTIINEVNGLADTLLTHLTDYASYLASELGEEHIIRTLPNGVKDEFDLGTGKLIKRVSNVNLRELDWVLHAAGDSANYYSIEYNKFPRRLYYDNEFTINYNYELLTGTFSTFRDFDGRAIYSAGASGEIFRIKIPKVDIDGDLTVEKAKAWLGQNQVMLTYQLAEPETIDLPEQMTPNTREIVRLSEQVDKLINML